ncbi:translation initiation factor III [Actinoplanes sp. NEAU-A12]|uniref:Translation initiation factor III n=1 Tax=Actinoplanes sandaracinus TaxID=3045177 RepID=A0ABT6WN38_9ACTN|nr:translation initiation factor III [Actinoplanes sandaracinus]MDI6101134.1 translation initiation factor III [Actinoplanes sandaracinus]
MGCDRTKENEESMARSKNTKATAPRVAVDVGSTGTRPASGPAVALLVLSILAAVWAVAMMTAPGRRAYYYFFAYVDYFVGVVSLVSLSITIMVGLVATDRLVLSIRQRVLLQSAHRTTGVIAVGALFVHVWTKFTKDFIGLIDIFVPFLVDGPNGLYVGLGTISGWIMVLVMWSGIARAKFIGRGRPWMWRGIHAISYLMWPIALTHGLSAGRPADTWVTVSYVVCVLGVLVGLAVRLSVSLNRRKDFASPAGVGAVKPQETGKLLPTAAAPIRRSSRRAEPATDLLAPAAGPSVPAWNEPVAGPSVPAWNEPVARPVSPAWNEPPARPVSPAPAPVARPVSAVPDLVDEDYPPRRRPEPEAPAPRQRRSVEDDERYDSQTRLSRRDVEEELYEYDDEPAPRARGARSQEIYDEAPRGRGRRFDDDDEPAPRPRLRDEVETTGARMRRAELESTSTRMRRDDLESTSVRMRRDDPAATGTRMRRDEIESTSARMRRYEEEEPAPRAPRREPDYPEYDDRPRGRRRAEEDYEEVPRPRAARYADEPAPRPARGARYEEEPPRRPSRSEFVDFADDPAYPVDDTPTLVDTGSRRARRGESGRGGRRGPDDGDDGYFSQLRGDMRESN